MSSSRLTQYHDTITTAIASGTTIKDLADSLGVPRKTLSDYVHRFVVAKPSLSGAVSREEILEAQLRDLRQAVTKDRRSDVQDERVMRAIEQALAEAPLPRLRPFEVAPPAPGARHRQAVLLSDWHSGEVVDPVQVGGLNEFNWAILERRVDDVRDALLSFKGVRPELTGLDLWFLGDMVSGDIHEELSVTNEFPVAEQSVKVGVLMAELVTSLAPHYPELRITCVSGNHARTKKPHASKNVFDSWDWVAYQHAMALTSKLETVTWHIPRAGMTVTTIAGMNWLLWHGDGVRSSMPGVPAGGVTRRANEFRKQYAMQGQPLDGLACGHFHSANMWAGNVFINGSLIGTNEHGLKNYGGGEAPKQLLLTFDERKSRITDVSFITPR